MSFPPIEKADGSAWHTNARFQCLVTAFQTRFGVRPLFVARAPGRVNLIGEHIDYRYVAATNCALCTLNFWNIAALYSKSVVLSRNISIFSNPSSIHSGYGVLPMAIEQVNTLKILFRTSIYLHIFFLDKSFILDLLTKYPTCICICLCSFYGAFFCSLECSTSSIVSCQF